MIKIITGAMFSGKSLKLINDIEPYIKVYGIENILFFKPKLDTRDNNLIKSRASDTTYQGILINDLSDIDSYITENIKMVVIDEVQFLTGDISKILKLHYDGINFLISGLNLTSEQKPFGIMPYILSIATEVNVLSSAKCFFCDKPAEYTKTNDMKDKDIEINSIYYPVCRECMKEVDMQIKLQ